MPVDNPEDFRRSSRSCHHRQGLDGFADGDDFFDMLADDVVFDYVITVPDYPRRVEGRQAVAALQVVRESLSWTAATASQSPRCRHRCGGARIRL
jgi:hypothetical protein